MRVRKKKFIIVISTLFIFDILLALMLSSSYLTNLEFQFQVLSEYGEEIQLFTGAEVNDFAEENSTKYKLENKVNLIETEISNNTNVIRIDFDNSPSVDSSIMNIRLIKGNDYLDILANLQDEITTNNCKLEIASDQLHVQTNGTDPYIILSLDQNSISSFLLHATTNIWLPIVFILIIIDLLLLLIYKLMMKSDFVKGIILNKTLIWSLSKNDFKTKYAGSFFGVLWAFVQPIVTVLLYWFVFQVGLRSGDVGKVPFVLWLISGLVPWFFFQDALTAITNSLIEYSYLVKKMVFQINILPVVKVFSAMFVHLFFIVFTLCIFSIMGYFPTLAVFQLLYYMVCSVMLVLGLGYMTCSLVLFFKDLGQIIQIFLQVGMWMTPIMWNIQMIPDKFAWIMKLNPMYYIVTGFRDSLIDHIWVWERMDTTLYFWVLNFVLFFLGTHIFKKLRCHFADVL